MVTIPEPIRERLATAVLELGTLERETLEKRSPRQMFLTHEEMGYLLEIRQAKEALLTLLYGK